jgi:hypothetical protein
MLSAATMEDWDQETLEKVVESKGQEYIQNKPTEIVLIFDKLLVFFFIFFYLFERSISHVVPNGVGQV